MITMMKRLLLLIAITLLAARCGAWLGTALSYWFVAPIMRLYLSWGDYLRQLPNNLLPGDPLNIWHTVLLCRYGGAIVMILLAVYGYNKYRNRKVKHVKIQNAL